MPTESLPDHAVLSTSFALGLSAVGLRDYAIGTLASLPALCGYVFIGTLTDTSLSAWATGASPIRWALLGGGGVATLILVVRLGQIALKLGLAPRAGDDLELTGDLSRADNLRVDWARGADHARHTGRRYHDVPSTDGPFACDHILMRARH